MLPAKIHIVGVGPGGASSLSPQTRKLVNEAEILLGGERLLKMFPSSGGKKVAIKDNLSEVAQLLKANLDDKRMVVLASGDPGFYGIAKYLTSKLGKKSIDIIPNVSAMQMAFARIGENWDDAALTSVHGRPIEEIVATVRGSRKVGIFTDASRTPGAIARVLLEQGVDNCTAYVCQDLGTPREKIVSTDLLGMKDGKFSPLNVVILLREMENKVAVQLLGMSEDSFRHPDPEGSLITKLEVRAIDLAKLGLTENSIVWDIGAGSGAVSVEASLLAAKGMVFAVEKNASALAAIKDNILAFGRGNIRVVEGKAPQALKGLPDPTAVFIGGSGGAMSGILKACCRRLKDGGRIVINAATLETLRAAMDGLRNNGFRAEATMVNISRSRDILDLTRFEALNPVFVVSGWREGKAGER